MERYFNLADRLPAAATLHTGWASGQQQQHIAAALASKWKHGKRDGEVAPPTPPQPAAAAVGGTNAQRSNSK
jgi:hypothetical protein